MSIKDRIWSYAYVIAAGVLIWAHTSYCYTLGYREGYSTGFVVGTLGLEDR